MDTWIALRPPAVYAGGRSSVAHVAKGAQATGQVNARGLVVHPIGEHARQHRVKVLFRQRRKLQKAGVQPLQFAFRHRVEVDAPNPLLHTGTLQPAQEDLRGARVCDCLLAQAPFDLCVRLGLAA